MNYLKNHRNIYPTCVFLYQYVALPPEMSNTKPVQKLHSFETIHALMAATSSTVPRRFIGIFAVIYANCFGSVLSFMAVFITAGARPLMVMPVSAYSLPIPFIIPITPAFDAEYPTIPGLPSLPAMDAINKMRP